MLLRCNRCLSRFAHDLFHCPQCGIEAIGSSSPDEGVVGEAAVAAGYTLPAEEPVAAPAPKLSKKAAAAAAAAETAESPTGGADPDAPPKDTP